MSSSGHASTWDPWGPQGGSAQVGSAHVRPELRGRTRGRLRGHLVLVCFIVGLAAAVGVGAAVVVLAAPGNPPLCQPYTPCGPPSTSMPLVNQTVWRSSAYGFHLEYPTGILAAARQDASGLTLNL